MNEDPFAGDQQEEIDGGEYDMEGDMIDEGLLHLQRAQSVSFLFYILDNTKWGHRFQFALPVKPLPTFVAGNLMSIIMKAWITEELLRLWKTTSIKFRISKHLPFM